MGLIEALDDKRAEQINFTFKQMIKHFSSIFSKIIPGGKGDLILTSDETEDFDSDVQRTINAKGVEISVSFTGEQFLYYAELITGPVFTAKGRIRPFLGYLGRFWPVFGSQRQYF